MSAGALRVAIAGFGLAGEISVRRSSSRRPTARTSDRAAALAREIAVVIDTPLAADAGRPWSSLTRLPQRTPYTVFQNRRWRAAS